MYFFAWLLWRRWKLLGGKPARWALPIAMLLSLLLSQGAKRLLGISGEADEEGPEVRVAGRIVAWRAHGNASPSTKDRTARRAVRRVQGNRRRSRVM